MIFKSRQPRLTEGWFWRHEIALPQGPQRFQDEAKVDQAWRELVLIHTSFRATAQDEYGEIVKGLRAIELLFLDWPDLNDYYEECHRAPGNIRINVAESDEVDPYRKESWPNRYRHVAAIQARFMEDVYFVLQLARFANALDNRGWMNLFRSWGQSGKFNSVWDQLLPTFTEEFVEFYRLYIRYYPGPIEEYPVPHPWDHVKKREDPRLLPADKYATVLPGVFLDSGIREASVTGDVRGAPLPSPGSESRGVTEEETKTLPAQADWKQSREGGEDTGSSSGSRSSPNN